MEELLLYKEGLIIHCLSKGTKLKLDAQSKQESVPDLNS